MRRLAILAAAALVLAAAVALAGVGRPAAAHGDTTTQSNTVTVTGHGDETAVPDQATVTAGVQSTAATAAAALSKNSTAMNAVVAALRKAGGTDLQTQEVSLDPQTNEQGRVTGYTAQDSVSADAKIAAAGALIDAAVAVGANTVDGPNLSVSDSTALYRRALADAVVDARGKAEALAQAGGFSLGPISSVAEDSTPTPIVFGAAASAKAAPTPIEPGTQDVTADVTVTFAIH